MAVIHIKVRDKEVRAALRRGAAAVTAALDVALEQGIDRVISDIRANDATLFTDPSGGLTGQLWRSGAKNGRIRAGWSGPSAVYGPVLEHGPKDKGPKPILPKNTLTKGYTNARGKTRSAGQPILALRIPITPQGPTMGGAPMAGGIIYRRRSTYRWDRSMLRPHWSWSVKKNATWMQKNIRKRVLDAVGKAMRGPRHG